MFYRFARSALDGIDRRRVSHELDWRQCITCPACRTARSELGRKRTSKEEISYRTSIVSRAALRLSSVGGILLYLGGCDGTEDRWKTDVVVWIRLGVTFQTARFGNTFTKKERQTELKTRV